MLKQDFLVNLSRLWRSRQRSLRNLQTTVVCGMITVLVLRGTLGGGSYGTPQQDFRGIRKHLATGTSRALFQLPQVQQEQQQQQRQQLIAPPHPLGEPILDWDSQRSAAATAAANSVAPTILMVTGSQPESCENPSGDHFLLRSLKNKVDYARLHGMQVYQSMASLDGEMTGFWSKLPLLRRLMLAHPSVEWFWWLDSDAIVTDVSFELPMASYANVNLVLHGWPAEVYQRRNWLGLNTGSFLLRNCQWSLDLLDAWAPMGPKGTVRRAAGEFLSRSLSGRPDFEADDQSALVYLLANDKLARWGDKVFLENGFALHGYWKMIVDKYEQLERKDWAFVTHFVGCKPCGKHGHYSAQECELGMKRALNFADDQVLEAYGFRHRDLRSAQVVEI